MKYESKLIVIEKSTLQGRDWENTKGMFWASKIAEYNLSEINYQGPFHQRLKMMRDTAYYYYADDGNTPVVIDRYRDKLKEFNIKPLVRILEKENKTNRRIQPAINLLKSFDNDQWQNICVLIYGY